MDVVGTFLKSLLSTSFGNGDLMDVGRVVPVVRPGHDGFAGIGKHAGELVSGPQIVVYIIDGAQRLAKVDVR
jgi:hypothetical protein